MSIVLDAPVAYRDLTTEQHRELLITRGLDAATADFLTRLDADLARGVSAEVTTDLRELIGRPITPLLTGLREAWG
jgi:NAD(P)H dehydrogenase (quinone)